MTPLADLMARRPVLFDGATGTELIKAGLLPDQCPEVFAFEHPEVMQALHRAYYQAGSDVVHACTFGANAVRLEKYGHAARIQELIVAAVENVKAVRPQGGFCAGDMGPTGLMRMGPDPAMQATMQAAFEEQAGLLAAAGVDLIDIETMYDLEETLLAVGAAKRTGLPVVASMTFNKTKRGYFTMMGVSVAKMASALERAGVEAVGANCTLGSGEMIGLARELRAATSLPLLVQPNAGQPTLVDGAAHYDQSPGPFSDDLVAMLDLGVRLLGGCCGSTPEFIAVLAQRVKPGSAGRPAGA